MVTTKKYWGVVDHQGHLYTSSLSNDQVKSWRLFVAALGFTSQRAAKLAGYECREVTVSY